MKKNNKKKGFTIVELVIVIAVIAILAAVLIPTFSNVIEKANKSAVLQEARNVYTEVYAEDIADGKLDNTFKDGYTKPSTVTTYTPASDGTKLDAFVYTDSTRGYTATFDGTDWEVAETSDAG